MSDAALIAIDWGTTSFRAWLVNGVGKIVEQVEAPSGILNVPVDGFGSVFDRLIGPWIERYGRQPTLASGMIGSRQGWREASYIQCPAGAMQLAERLVSVTSPAGHEVWIVPGVVRCGDDGIPDVMRGEETQIIGGLEKGDPPRRIFVLPGTHSKWAIVEQGRIVRFATFMTGELFAVLREHSILARLMTGDSHVEDAFARGVTHGGRAGAGLLHDLFGARTLALLDKLPASAVASYLSGLLIGREIADAVAWIGSPHLAAARPTIIGSAVLSPRYARALSIHGIESRFGRVDAAVQGIRRVLVAAGPLAAHR